MKLKKLLSRGVNWSRSRFTANSGILLYHRVAEPKNDRFKLCVRPGHFAEQMAVVSAAGGAVSLPELVAELRGGRLRAGSVAVTFDDGYVDNLREALPVLERYGVPATVFVVTGNFGERFWWDRLEDILGSGAAPPERLVVGGDGGEFEMEFKNAARDAIYLEFRRLGSDRRNRALAALAEAVGCAEGDPGEGRAMSVEELRELAEHPLITVGAHTVSHGQLSGMAVEEQRGEIMSSRKTLEEILGKRVTTFSYPFGLRGRDFTEETMAAARGAGLECALAADFNVVTRGSDPYALPRLWVHDWGGGRFRRAIGRWVSLPGSGGEGA